MRRRSAPAALFIAPSEEKKKVRASLFFCLFSCEGGERACTARPCHGTGLCACTGARGRQRARTRSTARRERERERPFLSWLASAVLAATSRAWPACAGPFHRAGRRPHLFSPRTGPEIVRTGHLSAQRKAMHGQPRHTSPLPAAASKKHAWRAFSPHGPFTRAACRRRPPLPPALSLSHTQGSFLSSTLHSPQHTACAFIL
jgi:hypothetical protein